MPSKTVKIPNITCEHCVRTIEMELNDLEGVNKVSADEGTKLVTVEWSTPMDWAGIVELLEEIDFPPEAEQ